MTRAVHLDPSSDLPVILTRRLGTPGWWITSPVVAGPTIHATDTGQLASALAHLWRDRDPDLYPTPDQPTDVAPRPPGRVSNTSWNVDLWQPLPDGYWLSPTGKVYRPGSEMVGRIVRKRTALGLSVEYGGEASTVDGWVQEWMPL